MMTDKLLIYGHDIETKILSAQWVLMSQHQEK